MKTATAHALDTGRRFVKMGCEAAQLKSNLAVAAKDARRAARRGFHAAEDFLDECATAVKRQPLKAIGVTFGVALGIGALAGWLGTRR